MIAEGLEAYAEGDYSTAASLFEEAYAKEPNEQLLFAWAQSERFRGNCRRALELYDQVLKTKLTKANRSAVRAAMKECRGRLESEEKAARASRAERESTSAPARPESTSQSNPRRAPEASSEQVAPGPDSNASAAARLPSDATADGAGARAWYKDPVGGILTGVGIVGIGVGIGLYVSASSANSSADEADRYSEFERLKDKARSRGRLAVISASAGAALLVLGVAWYALRDRSPAQSEAAQGLSFWLDGDGGGFVVVGSF